MSRCRLSRRCNKCGVPSSGKQTTSLPGGVVRDTLGHLVRLHLYREGEHIQSHTGILHPPPPPPPPHLVYRIFIRLHQQTQTNVQYIVHVHVQYFAHCTFQQSAVRVSLVQYITKYFFLLINLKLFKLKKEETQKVQTTEEHIFKGVKIKHL